MHPQPIGCCGTLTLPRFAASLRFRQGREPRLFALGRIRGRKMNTENQGTLNQSTDVTAQPVMRLEALALAREGFAVLPLYEITPEGGCACGRPCRSPGKHPVVKHGVKEATKDPETIRQWFNTWPTANIG